jgi:putative hemolysin
VNKNLIILSSLICLMLLLAGCTRTPSSPGTVTPAVTTPASSIANPAAVYCTQQPGTRYEIRTNPDGSQYGVCILPGGVECEEWKYYRHECPAAPTPAATTPGAGIANPSATYCVLQNNTYQIVTNPDGSQAGNCVFPSGKACDGWAYYRGECNETTAK